MTSSLPFRRGAFRDLPPEPRLPHPFAHIEGRNLRVTTRELGETTAHVRVHGSGPPLFLVHGLMTSSYSWRYVYEPLGRHFTVYAPDLPGNGLSRAELSAPYHPDAFASWLGELMRV